MPTSNGSDSPPPSPELTPSEMGDYEDFRNDSLDALQTAQHLKLLNAMDKLRTFGVSEVVSLPQIIVCGDQSAGKSSVLEAITQIPFPRKETTCTRFATQIVLRRSSVTRVSVAIIPDPNPLTPLTVVEAARLRGYSATLTNFSNLEDIIEAAGNAMGTGTGSGTFSQHVLNIEISGPRQPHLTVVDLPGLIHTGTTAQGNADVKIVSALVESYMKNERTIILAVVSAMNDIQNQVILTRARELDPKGSRTLGVITKPDTVPEGSEKEEAFISLARNEQIFFSHGWHVLRNRSYKEREQTFDDRNQAEELFFTTGAWSKLDKRFVGIARLRERLSQLLHDHIKAELPKVYSDIKRNHDECVEKLEKLGTPRVSVHDQRRFLVDLSMRFVHLSKAAVDGSYDDPFFGEGVPPSVDDRPKRLRGVSQNLALEFAAALRKQGHTYAIAGITPEKESDTSSDTATTESEEEESEDEEEEHAGIEMEKIEPPSKKSKKWAIGWIKPLIQHSRGRELPGHYNPMLVGNVFWEQSKNWDPLGKNHLTAVHKACMTFVGLLMPHIASEQVRESIINHWLNKAMEDRLKSAREELKKVLQDRRNHAITYNHYYTDNVQKLRAEDAEKQVRKAWAKALAGEKGFHTRPCDKYGCSNTVEISCKKPDLDALLEAFSSRVKLVDMDEYAATEVLHSMQAFYKVASKTFVDNVATLVIERHLLGSLWEVFSPQAVYDMPDELVGNIAAESPETVSLRGLLQKKKEMLAKGLAAVEEVVRGSRLG